MRKIKYKIILSSLLLILFFGLGTYYSYAAVPHLINYQGRLTDKDGKPLDGAYSLSFKIYDVEAGGTPLWDETHTGVVIQKGVFSVILGGVKNLDLLFDKQYFLEIQIGSEIMSPRQRITSAAYAIRAEHGVPRGVIVMWSGKIADIPLGWALCDGNNGTPDLRNRFIVCADADVGGMAKSTVTGSAAQSGDGQIIQHNHGVSSITVQTTGAHTHDLKLSMGDGNEAHVAEETNEGSHFTDTGAVQSAGNHTHILTGNTDNAGTGTKNIAVYYALAFIMKLS